MPGQSQRQPRHAALASTIVAPTHALTSVLIRPGGTQLKRKTPLTKYIALVFEVAICAIHPFPYVYSDIEVYFILKDTPMFYRFESATAGFMFLRIYLVWRWFKLVAFFRTPSPIPLPPPPHFPPSPPLPLPPADPPPLVGGAFPP